MRTESCHISGWEDTGITLVADAIVTQLNRLLLRECFACAGGKATREGNEHSCSYCKPTESVPLGVVPRYLL